MFLEVHGEQQPANDREKKGKNRLKMYRREKERKRDNTEFENER